VAKNGGEIKIYVKIHEVHESLCSDAASIVRPSVCPALTIFFKRLLKNH